MLPLVLRMDLRAVSIHVGDAGMDLVPFLLENWAFAHRLTSSLVLLLLPQSHLLLLLCFLTLDSYWGRDGLYASLTIKCKTCRVSTPKVWVQDFDGCALTCLDIGSIVIQDAGGFHSWAVSCSSALSSRWFLGLYILPTEFCKSWRKIFIQSECSFDC